MLEEYRESVDIDFLISDKAGYARLRQIVHDSGFNGLIAPGTECNLVAQASRTERDKIQFWIAPLDPTKEREIKIEIVLEARISLDSGTPSPWGVETLSRVDLFAEKLLANVDRWNDHSSANRDILDLALMIQNWGPIPDAAWEKTQEIYGNSIYTAFFQATRRLADEGYLRECLDEMQFSISANCITAQLHQQLKAISTRSKEPEEIINFISAEQSKIIEFVAQPLQITPPPELYNFFSSTRPELTLKKQDPENGDYCGNIIWTNNEFAIQEIGPNIVIVHAARDWHPPASEGCLVRVKYQHGLSQLEN